MILTDGERYREWNEDNWDDEKQKKQTKKETKTRNKKD
jgi:hypothetical protein